MDMLVFLFGFLLIAGMTGEVLAADKDFPIKPINLYVGYAPGGGTSMMARAIASKAGEILSVPIVVLNKPGAGGTISVDFVRRSKADGYSLVVGTMSNLVTGPIITKVPYQIDDLDFWGMFAAEYMIMMVNSNSPWKTLEELIDYAKKHPGELKYASVGHGSGQHVTTEMLNHVIGIKTVHVPMKGDAEILSSILGGHCQFAMAYSSGVRSVKEGERVRFLATTSEQRMQEFPDVPTFVEKGYPGVGFMSFYVVAGPPGMPKEVSDKLKDAFEKTFKDNEFHRMLEKFGVIPTYMPADQCTKFVQSEEKRLRKFIKEIGLETTEKK